MVIQISNKTARRIFLAKQGLSAPPSRALGKPDLLQLICDLGFVQVDSISTVERAHNQILFSRNQTFRRDHLRQLLEEDRALFEHWTHDAAIVPTAFYPYWKHRFARQEESLRKRWAKWRGEGFDKVFDETYARFADGGACLAREVKQADHKSGGWWQWHPSKTALEFLWHTGKLAISARRNFQKIYDLSERVIPADQLAAEVSHDEFVEWACRSALQRLGFATHGEIAAFWDLVSPQEAKAWVADNRRQLEEIEIECAGTAKPRASFGFSGLPPKLQDWPEPPARVRVLSPFDPLLRDRNRAERLFGFRYRIEVFVPEHKREYGYYVFPLLEGDRMIGRIDMKADRRAGTLNVTRLWLEPKIRASAGRMARLDAELVRLARFTGVSEIVYADGWNNST
ncbi:winged helix-turn-helix domain-containing protein [Hoeflea sp. YIM 152468]|uniref:winged helix-turn-helix domain-containing protein n=1 Tax=Hoeflea sp. YIM 152468 TaxID=3031759 RepID=UPI0023DC0235|nr:winged helix-turn-helix domain-containing protein [Hoeflea sp. YIM 152468]MDF1608591.1 winged helix-turn-helix domain-containing protein [Hoeflea sp. YIM 152468]